MTLLPLAPLTGKASEKGAEKSGFKFARQFTDRMLLDDGKKLAGFIDNVISAESNFNRPGVSFNEKTGLTYDGYSINYITGELVGTPHVWSAASKESIHLMLLALAVADSREARTFIYPSRPAHAASRAVDLLEKKIRTYEKFKNEYPAFGGFLPWFIITDEGIKPTAYESKPEWDWQDRMPGLDNGQFAWALFFASHILHKHGYEKLAKRYDDYWNSLADNSVPIFYDPPTGKIRAESKILDPKRSGVDPSNYSNNSNLYYLDDPYEGELLVVFMSLFGKWDTPDRLKKIWHDKKLTKKVYKTMGGKEISVRWGHWYSSHEMWNFLLLPYRDDPLIKEVFRLGEVARTYYSAEAKIPGLFASVNSPPGSYPANIEYLSAVGVQKLAKMEILSNNVITPYAAFPVIIADKKKGLVWYKSMLSGPRMQGPYGSTESITVDGRLIAPLITWESKITTILAILNENIMDHMREALKARGKYDGFIFLVGREYKEAFGSIESLKGRDLDIMLPTAQIPLSIPDFDFVYSDNTGNFRSTEIFRGSLFYGDGNLFKKHRQRPDGSILIPPADGYIWNGITHTDIKKNHVLNFVVNSEGGSGKGLFIEIKNISDQLITQDKLRVEFPDTEGEYRVFSVDIKDLICNPNTNAAIFAFSDCNAVIESKSITLSSSPPQGSEPLSFDGRRFASGLSRQDKPWTDILGYNTFISGGKIDYAQDTGLYLKTSHGWLWSFVSKNSIVPIDLNDYRYLHIKVRTYEGSVFMLELKHKFDTGEEEQIPGYYGCPKMTVYLPDTEGRYKTIKIPISVRRSMKNNSRMDIVAISDPVGEFEISEMRFSKK